MRCLKKQKVILAVLLLLLTSLLAISGSMPIIETVETFIEVHSHEHEHENGNIPHHHSFDFKGSGSGSPASRRSTRIARMSHGMSPTPSPESRSGTGPGSGFISQPVNKNLMEYKEAWKNLQKNKKGHLTGEGYTHVGHPNESEIINDMGPNNTLENLWKANSNFVQTFVKNPKGDKRTGPDGGWNYTINDVTHESGYLSIVYFKIPYQNKRNGRFYHGPSIGGKTLKINGIPISRPEYFASGIKLFSFNVNEWYVSIGVILPYKEGGYSSAPETIGGIYKLSTGEKIRPNKNFMMKPGITKQNHRTFQFYSSNSNSEIFFARPGFYKMDGSEPTLEDILNLQNID